MLVAAADVEVTDRSTHRSAALGDFLCQALGDFGGEIAGVELRDGRHDPVNEHPRRGLIDALSGRDERDTGGEEGFVDLHVVGTVAGQPVELVHDAEVHPRRRNEREHLLEPVAVGGASGLARVHELPHHSRPQLGGFTSVGFALGGNREAFLGAAAFGLLPRRDPQIGHRQQHRRVRARVRRCRRSDAHGVLRSGSYGA